MLRYLIFVRTLNTTFYLFFFFNDTAPTEIYTLSLHDALPISPAKLIEKRAREPAQLANRAQDLSLELAGKPVCMSEEYLAKIVDELVQNAFKFSQAGTRVSVRLEEVPAGVALTVTDHGRGFSTEHITKVGAYMQFDRKMQEQQGLGLGLSIAKRLTELHGGTLGIQTDPD